MIYNENFYDFFGILEEEIRSIYSKNNRVFYMPEIHEPIPKLEIPMTGIHSIGYKATTINTNSEFWLKFLMWFVIALMVGAIIYVIWDVTRPEEYKKEKEPKMAKG